MNKEERKKLIQEYKRKSLEKHLDSGNSVMEHYAKIQLGLSSEPITKAGIKNTSDEKLIELLCNKIEEVAERIYKENPQVHKTANNALKTLSVYYQFIYYTDQFEMLLKIGDIDKYFENTPTEEIEIVAKSYNLIGFRCFSNLIREASKDNQIEEIVEKEFNNLKRAIDKVRIEFVREKASLFEIE